MTRQGRGAVGQAKQVGVAIDNAPRLPAIVRQLGAFMVLVGSLAAVFSPALIMHIRLSASRLWFNDDARQQIYPFLSTYKPGLFPNDYAARYFLACFPIGFRTLYTSLAFVTDPVGISKAVPYVLFGVLLVSIGIAAHRLSGWIGCWFALAFCLSSPYFLARLAGGLPRGFGLALLACAVAALVVGSMRVLAVVTVLSAGFYAPAAVLSGVCLAVVTFLLPYRSRGDLAGWTFVRRAVLVGVTAVACVVVLLPAFVGSMAYGRTLGPADVVTYPELGTMGRYDPDDRTPFDVLPQAMLKMIPEAFRGKEDQWGPGRYDWVARRPTSLVSIQPLQWVMYGLAMLLGLGLPLVAWRNPAALRFLVLPAVASVAYVVAVPLAPTLYLPQRYTAYAIPLAAVVGLPAVCAAFARLMPSRSRWLEPVCVGFMCGAVLLYTGGRGNSSSGLDFEQGNTPIYTWAATTPPDTVIAAWNQDLANNLPYLIHRQVLINQETHQIFHQHYADEMRARMNALIDAYLATDIEPLRTLHEHYGVRYLVVDERHYNGDFPLYFEPFNQRIKEELATLRDAKRDPIVVHLVADAAVFRDGEMAVLDLAQLDASTTEHQPAAAITHDD